MPQPTYKLANKAKFGRNVEDELNEWERNLVKGLFDKYLEGRKGVAVSDLIKIMERLAEDECVLGKVPNCDPEDYPGLM